MILYFTGTGNSEYVADKIAKETEEKVLNLFQRIRDNDHSPLHSETPWIVVAPTYAWRIPHILEKWLEQTPLTGSKDIYFIMTCFILFSYMQRNFTPQMPVSPAVCAKKSVLSAIFSL